MSDSARPPRRQPMRLPRPWDSPGKNTGVGCHFLLQCIKVKVKSLSGVWLLATNGMQPTSLLHPWDFPGKSTGVGCHCLLQKILISYLFLKKIPFLETRFFFFHFVKCEKHVIFKCKFHIIFFHINFKFWEKLKT